MKDMQKGFSNQLNELMTAQMSRGEFLQYLGVAMLGIVGVTGLMKNLRHALPHQKPALSKFAAGYGRGAYGR